MEKILVQFIDTLDSSLKKTLVQAGNIDGLSKLTINQFHYIDAIYALGEPSITEIAARLQITKASVTVGINKLVFSGLVEKTQSQADRRMFHVRLSETGRQLVEAKYQALEEYGDFIRSALTEEEVRQFSKILAKLVRLFQDNKIFQIQ